MMPGMDGYEVCRRLKANPATRDIPVIFVTAMSEVEDETRGLELGGVDYVTKPISAPIVKARVKTHLALYQQAREMQRLIAKLEAQAGELAEWNRTLEQRVAEGVTKVDRLSRLKRFFSPSVVDLLLSGSAEDPLKSHRREIAAVFLDLRGFTTFTETSDPEDVMGVIGEYHEAMGRLVMAHGGTLERFAGDGIMIFFNDPVEVDNPAAEAVKMAIAMQERFATLAQGWHKRGYAHRDGNRRGAGLRHHRRHRFRRPPRLRRDRNGDQSCGAAVRRGGRRADPHFAAGAGSRRAISPARNRSASSPSRVFIVRSPAYAVQGHVEAPDRMTT